MCIQTKIATHTYLYPKDFELELKFLGKHVIFGQ